MWITVEVATWAATAAPGPLEDSASTAAARRLEIARMVVLRIWSGSGAHAKPREGPAQSDLTGGEAGIRTLGTGFSPYNGLANRRLQPLGHLTAGLQVYVTTTLTRKRSVASW